MIKKKMNKMSEEYFLKALKHALYWEFQKYDTVVETDELNNRVMLSFEDSDIAFDIRFEKE